MKLRNQFALVLAAGSIMFTSCKSETAGAAKVDLVALKADLQKMEDAFAAGEKAKDADAIVAYYAEDATSYNRNEAPSVGKAAIRAKQAENLAKDTTGNVSKYDVVDVFADGDLAVEIGSNTVTTPAGETSIKGYYMSVFRKTKDGKYECIRDMSVSTVPVKP